MTKCLFFPIVAFYNRCRLHAALLKKDNIQSQPGLRLLNQEASPLTKPLSTKKRIGKSMEVVRQGYLKVTLENQKSVQCLDSWPILDKGITMPTILSCSGLGKAITVAFSLILYC